MDYPIFIKELYSSALDKEICGLNVDVKKVGCFISSMAEAYKTNPNWKIQRGAIMVDYNIAAQRCAYLHKYAMLHTGLLCEVLPMAFKIYSLKQYVESKDSLKLCSLGGGPGSDIVSLLLVIQEVFGLKKFETSIIDYAPGWKYTFGYVISSLVEMPNSKFKHMLRKPYQYLNANLLDSSSFGDAKIHDAIKDADILSMVKFISAAACNRTKHMLEVILRIMKPGSMLLFADNAGGGFYEMIEEKAKEHHLLPIYGPHRHYDYKEDIFNNTRFGHTAQYNTKVTIVLYKKSSSDVTARMDDVLDSPFAPYERDGAFNKEDVTVDSSDVCCAIM